MSNNNIGLLNELKHLYSLKTNKQIAEKFNIKIKTIDKWIYENKIPESGFAVQYIELLISNAEMSKKLRGKFEEMGEIVDFS